MSGEMRRTEEEIREAVLETTDPERGIAAVMASMGSPLPRALFQARQMKLELDEEQGWPEVHVLMVRGELDRVQKAMAELEDALIELVTQSSFRVQACRCVDCQQQAAEMN